MPATSDDGRIGSVEMGPSYLIYLAKLGATAIHPLGRQATGCLIAALNPRPNERLLEIGCGTAETMARLILQGGVRVDGVDLLPPMLKVGQERLSLMGVAARASLARASGTALPMVGESYDAVFTESVLGFQSEVAAKAMLREVRRVLKPGGRYVANEAIWKKGTEPETVAAIHRAGVASFGLSQASPQPWMVDDWVRMMEETGFRVASADLLAERVAAHITAQSTSEPWQLRLSALLTATYRFRGLLTPLLLLQKWQFRRRLAQHREDGRFLESRLFVLIAS